MRKSEEVVKIYIVLVLYGLSSHLFFVKRKMTEIVCEYKECEFCKDGKCTRDRIKVIYGAWDDDSCPVCVTGFWGEGVDYSEEVEGGIKK